MDVKLCNIMVGTDVEETKGVLGTVVRMGQEEGQIRFALHKVATFSFQQVQ
jgi:hypothetical protein